MSWREGSQTGQGRASSGLECRQIGQRSSRPVQKQKLSQYGGPSSIQSVRWKKEKTHDIKLVNDNDDLLNSQTPDEQRVLPRLPARSETALELSRGSVDDEDSSVGLGSARDHVGDEVSVSRSVKKGEVTRGSREVVEGNVHRDTSARNKSGKKRPR
jgi:hypothetical protein